jgi:hypothetical protein
MIKNNTKKQPLVTTPAFTSPQMSTVTTVITMGDPLATTVEVSKTSWTLEQIQIVSAVAWAMYHLDADIVQCYTLVDDKMMDEDRPETFEWSDNTITQTWLGSKYPSVYRVEHKDGYIILSRDHPNKAILTFKDGLLESIGDAPAVHFVMMNSRSHKIWFHANKCYRKANPELYASEEYNLRGYYDINGLLHRELSQGPATCWIDDSGKIEEDSGTYYLHGEPACIPLTGTTHSGDIKQDSGTSSENMMGVVNIDWSCRSCGQDRCAGHINDYVKLR